METTHSMGNKPKKITFFDVEYANLKNKSICQVGLICRDFDSGVELLPPLDLYVNPEDGFDESCVRVHGIAPKTVENAPTFPMLWEQLKPYFTNATIIGHNVAGADLNALYKTLIRYEIEVPQLKYICTLKLAQKRLTREEVADYRLATLCDSFGIQIERAHNALDDAEACMRLFDALVDQYGIDLEAETSLYCGACTSKKTKSNKFSLEDVFSSDTFSTYVCNQVVRRKVADFYGIIKGIKIDHVITAGEEESLVKWRKENKQYAQDNEITAIITILNAVLKKKMITDAEVTRIEKAVEPFLSVATTACETLAIQILNGILKGIIADGEVTQEECQNLYEWIQEHNAFIEKYPFKDTVKLLKPVIKQEDYTDADSLKLMDKIEKILNPVQTQSKQPKRGLNLTGKIICLSGNFAYGKKAEVTKLIQEHGGIVEESVKRNTDILVVGANESQAYAHGRCGTKVLKAMQNNKTGSNTKIMTEADFFAVCLGQ